MSARSRYPLDLSSCLAESLRRWLFPRADALSVTFSGSSTLEPPVIQQNVVIGDGPVVAHFLPAHRGKPVAVDGPVKVVLSDQDHFEVGPGPDPLSATFTPKGPPGSTEVTATVDADLGSGVKPLALVFQLVAVPPMADSLTVEFDQPAPVPTPAPSPPPSPAPSPAPAPS